MKKLAIALPIIFVALTVSCLKKPGFPSIETTVRIPVIDTTYLVTDFLPSDSFLTKRPDSLFELRFSFPIDTVNIGNSMGSYAGMDTSVALTVGEITLDSLASTSNTLYFTDFNLPRDILDSLSKVESVVVFIPPLEDTTFLRIDSLKEIHTLWGQDANVALSIINDLPIDLTPVTITVENENSGGDVIFTKSLSLDRKAPYSTEIEIPEVFLSNRLKVLIETASPGSGEPVWVKPNDSLSIRLLISSVKVDSAEALFPADTLDLEILKNLGGEFTGVDTIILKSGALHLDFSNGLPFDNWVTAEFPSLDTVVNFWVAKKSEKRKNIDLRGRPVILLGKSTFPVDIKVTHQEGWGWLKKEDCVNATIVMDELVPRYISGDSLGISVSVGEKDTIVPHYRTFKGIGFDEASLRAHIESWAGVKGDLTLHIKAFSEEGKREIERHILIPPALHGMPGAVDTVVDISNVFQRYPRRVSFQGEMSLAGPGFLEENQKAFGDMEIVVPSIIKLTADTFVSDTSRDTAKIAESDIKDVRKASLHLRVKNHTPLSAFLSITIKPPQYANLEAVSESLNIPCAPYVNDGKVIRDTTVEVVIPLNRDEIEVFTTKPRLSWTKLFLKPASGDTATLRTTDFIGIKSYAEIKYEIVK